MSTSLVPAPALRPTPSDDARRMPVTLGPDRAGGADGDSPRDADALRAGLEAGLRARLPDDLSVEQLQVLWYLQRYEWAEVIRRTGWSKGRIYRLALRTGARKTEARIQEKAVARRKWQQDFLQEVLNTTVTADVLDYLDGLPDNSVAAHLSSIPYNVAKRYGECVGADSLPFLAYYGWVLQVLSGMARTLKPGGVLFLQLGWTIDWRGQLMPLDVLLFEDLHRAGLTFQNRVIWPSTHGLTPEDRLAGRHETALVFSKGPVASFNPNSARTPQKQPGKKAFKGPNRGFLSGHPYGAFPCDVWDDIPTVRHNHPDRRFGAHPAQFPVKLVKRAILLYTRPGDLVVDVFSGSGSTQVGAIETGRAFSGCDLFYEDLRAARLAAATPDLVSVLPGISDESAARWQAEHALRRERPAMAPPPVAAEVAPATDVVGDGEDGDAAAPCAPWQAAAVPVHVPAAPIDDATDRQLALEFAPPAQD